MLNRTAFRFVVAGLPCLALGLGCSSAETKLTKKEEANFKGSKDMNAEAQQKMQEGMERMAKFNEELAKQRASQPQAPTPAPQKGGG